MAAAAAYQPGHVDLLQVRESVAKCFLLAWGQNLTQFAVVAVVVACLTCATINHTLQVDWVSGMWHAATARHLSTRLKGQT